MRRGCRKVNQTPKGVWLQVHRTHHTTGGSISGHSPPTGAHHRTWPSWEPAEARGAAKASAEKLGWPRGETGGVGVAGLRSGTPAGTCCRYQGRSSFPLTDRRSSPDPWKLENTSSAGAGGGGNGGNGCCWSDVAAFQITPVPLVYTSGLDCRLSHEDQSIRPWLTWRTAVPV